MFVARSLVALLALLVLAPSAHAYATQGTVWPHPKHVSPRGAHRVAVAFHAFRFELANTAANQSSVLSAAVVRYWAFTFPRRPVLEPPLDTGDSSGGDAQQLHTLRITTDSAADRAFKLGDDESYTLKVTTDPVATLTAPTVWGALRGLETFSQLVQFNSQLDRYEVHDVPVNIDDAPRFPWRGLLIDTSRHYMKMSTLQRQIDMLAFNKFNTLHWHIVDAEAFPLVSETFPRLASEGAWGTGADRYVYTKDDVRRVHEYARYRGIRVVMEIDTPGHTQSWGYGYPHLMAKCPNLAALSAFNPAFTPIVNSTYEFINSLFDEMTPLFSDSYMHIGGDELNFDCWAEDYEIRQYAANHNIDMRQLYKKYWDRLVHITHNHGKTPVCWEEVFFNGLNPPQNSVIEIWLSRTRIAEVARAGYNVIQASGFYLDLQKPMGNAFGEYGYYQDVWKDFYRNDPHYGDMTTAEMERVLGGEAACWGEQVDDHVIDPRIWPRASAIGERLWSPRDVLDLVAAERRLRHMHCHWVLRGIRSNPIFPGPPCEL